MGLFKKLAQDRFGIDMPLFWLVKYNNRVYRKHLLKKFFFAHSSLDIRYGCIVVGVSNIKIGRNLFHPYPYFSGVTRQNNPTIMNRFDLIINLLDGIQIQ